MLSKYFGFRARATYPHGVAGCEPEEPQQREGVSGSPVAEWGGVEWRGRAVPTTAVSVVIVVAAVPRRLSFRRRRGRTRHRDDRGVVVSFGRGARGGGRLALLGRVLGVVHPRVTVRRAPTRDKTGLYQNLGVR